MMNEVYTQDEYIMEQDDTPSDEGKRKMGGRSAKLFCRPAALFNAPLQPTTRARPPNFRVWQPFFARALVGRLQADC
jgi:hypothetical protein